MNVALNWQCLHTSYRTLSYKSWLGKPIHPPASMLFFRPNAPRLFLCYSVARCSIESPSLLAFEASNLNLKVKIVEMHQDQAVDLENTYIVKGQPLSQ